jgi:hypothetical protein
MSPDWSFGDKNLKDFEVECKKMVMIGVRADVSQGLRTSHTIRVAS